MYALFLSMAAVTVVVSQTAWACDGPNCPMSSRSTYGSARPRFDAPNVPRFGSMAPQTACGCNSCDSSRPCSPSSCARQGCQDCGPNCSTCPSARFNENAPVSGLTPTGISRRRSPSSQPRLTAQTVCPVTREKLGSMGPPIPVQVKGQTVYVCCEGCVNALRRNPEKYLSSRLPRDLGTRDRANGEYGRMLH